jgi:uncharacterized phage protein gp47/JayE
MATFPTPSQIQTQYLTILQSIKPTLNINDQNSDFVIRGNAMSGVVSGLYGDQQNVDNDTWISTARPEALPIFGQDYALPSEPATQATSENVTVVGVNSTVITVGELTFLYVPTGVLYQNTTGGTITGGVLSLSIQALSSGSIGNVLTPATLQIVSPPTGVGQTATLTEDIAGGSDPESTDSYRARLLARRQSPPAGGNQADYAAWPFTADPAVRSAEVIRFGRGLGTVDVYITAGTTDIDNAVTNGLPIVRVPSGMDIDEVQTYLDTVAPLTDCPEVFGPTEQDIDVTVAVDLATGYTMSSVPSDPVNNPLNLTCQQLIQREVGRVLYEYSVGGRVLPGGSQGYVVASDIEEGLDVWLSAVKDFDTGLAIGIIPILADRQIEPLNGSSYNLPINGNILPAPGVITVTSPVP